MAIPARSAISGGSRLQPVSFGFRHRDIGFIFQVDRVVRVIALVSPRQPEDGSRHA
jgi:hypothetical protein